MPRFTEAEVSTNGTVDISPYLSLLAPHGPGTRISLPLTAGDRPRMVARALNRAAKEQGKRLRKVTGDGSSINVVVMSGERRRSGLTIDQIEARTAKAKATREAKKAAEAAGNPDRFKSVLAESLAKITG